MIFRQLFETDSSTYTYLISCSKTGKTVLIDPVLETVERDLKVLRDMGLSLDFVLDTHLHADHLTGSRKLSALTGCKICGPALDELPCTDIGVREGEVFKLGDVDIHPLYTPGHTDTHHAYRIDTPIQSLLFSGDALLIDACGRTDFQSGDAGQLYDSIQEKFFSLPDETLVYPAHDYDGRMVSSIGQEKVRNPRLGQAKSRDEFIAIMNGLDLPYPRKIDFAVPGNALCGECPPNVPEELRGPCAIHEVG
ncbi:MAG: MBL fold metallo-hydrolase [Gammaproteobacteria bacterium]|nr:MBL fold metallo-hydrolase [Gammaproteobacteria bacterium]